MRHKLPHPDDDSSFDAPDVATTSARLRLATQDVHTRAERSGFLADLIRGRGDLARYVLFLRNLEPVYAALETRLERSADSPLLAPFRVAGLSRHTAIVADVDRLAGPDWRTGLTVLPQTKGYVTAIEAAADDTIVLAAHAYVRYLGDLSGGQILSRLLQKSLALPPESLTFYAFPDLGDPADAKTAMRRGLDGLPPDGADAEKLIAAAIDGFRHNIEMSCAIAESGVAAAQTGPDALS